MKQSSVQSITCDWKANKGRRRIQVILLMFRLAQLLRRGGRRPSGVIASGIYRFFALNFAAVDLPVQTKVGPGLAIHHGFGLVVNGRVVIGADVQLRQGVTLGSRVGNWDCPTIGDRVSIGASALVLGDIHIGSDCIIGAGAVVINNVSQGRAVAGNPARELR